MDVGTLVDGNLNRINSSTNVTGSSKGVVPGPGKLLVKEVFPSSKGKVNQTKGGNAIGGIGRAILGRVNATPTTKSPLTMASSLKLVKLPNGTIVVFSGWMVRP